MKISPRELREAQIPSKAFGFNQDVVDALLERAADTIEGLIEENRQLFEALERLRSEGASAPVSDPFEGVTPAAEHEPAPVVAPAAQEDTGSTRADLDEKEDLINKTLLLAQKTADETLRTAKIQAEELVTMANTEAQDLVEKAKAEAENLEGASKEEAESKVANAITQAQEMVSQAQSEADSIVATAQAQADSIHAEERDRFVALVTQLTNEREQLVSDIKILQHFDSEHRAKLQQAVQSDLEKLQGRDTLDIDKLPEMPKVQDIPVPEPTAPVVSPAAEPEVVAHSTGEVPSVDSFDDVMEPAQDDEVVVAAAGDDEIHEAEIVHDEPKSAPRDPDDPFAAFVDAPVVEPAGDDSDAQIVEPASTSVDSSDSHGVFDPGAHKKGGHQSDMSDDDFFASLREAVSDDTPLGTSDEDDNDGDGLFKGIFKK